MPETLILKKNKIWDFLEKCSKEFDVYAPVENKETGIIDLIDFKNIEKKDEINFKEKLKKGIKHFVLPATEKIFNFEYIKDVNDPESIKISLTTDTDEKAILRQGRKKILFGVKPCDTAGVRRLDIIFADETDKSGNSGSFTGPEDNVASGKNKKEEQFENYLKRRKDLLLITIGCVDIFPDCFCSSVGGHPFDFKYSDIGLIDMKDYFQVIKISDNPDAQSFIEIFNEFTEKINTSENSEAELKKIFKKSESECFSNWERIDGHDIAALMEKNFNDENIWKNISEKCIGCAACTFVCPTCLCFSINDERNDLKGERYKCWDFCTSYYYTLEASGHNPRGELYQRYRNKVNCKYHYYYKRKESLYCVGCGRCIDVCPAGMDIRDAVNIISGRSNR